ncbi:glycosyltransferase family 4 protein [Chloroflexus aggregans]|uniref:Glycosyl transferase group 1 n=1 Tax=Chloroflexus aggregans (strain MD-66 / DSM 9485) TaxID=326427 RepID=B8G9E6_CHLAD|nr:glycosyltransferase family 4 protein [Chloroflexus aggregans]ACL24436.1 glycosyl transferase group 1 [Chloroflexus aggregans DSM 9485]
MHILYLHQYFTTRAGSGGTRSYEFARYFVQNGHRVTIVTAADPQTPWAGGWWRQRVVDGINVVEVRAGDTDYRRKTALGYGQRMVAFLLFALASVIAVLRVARPDVVFATSTPLTIGIPGIIASRWHRVPLVFEVRDLWPEAPLQMGALRHPALILAARWLERTIYRHSRHIIALSPGMRQGILDTGVPPEKVSVIPNAADLDLFHPLRDGRCWRERLGHPPFLALYFGTMGEANDLQQVIEAARILQSQGRDDILIVLAGQGRQRPQLEEKTRDYQLRNVRFLDPLPKTEVADLVAAADVCLTIFKAIPVLATCSPNKLFDALAAGKAVIVNTPGWLQQLVETHQCGRYARAGDPADLAAQIAYLCDHPAFTKHAGQQARYLAEQQFDRRQLAAAALTILQTCTTN